MRWCAEVQRAQSVAEVLGLLLLAGRSVDFLSDAADSLLIVAERRVYDLLEGC